VKIRVENGRQLFSVSIYNREIRSLLKQNTGPRFFDDQWGEIHVHDVIASNEEHARALISGHFPPDDGFVIEEIKQLSPWKAHP